MHVSAIAKIDDTFGQLGIKPSASGRRGRRGRRKKPATTRRFKTKARGRGGRRRRKYATSGTDSILAFVKKAGAKGASGASIATHWKREKRKGSSYNIINAMLKKGMLRRKKLKGERGSAYSAA